MARGVSPQLGFNTNIRHKGKVYHVQTEDSGVAHPHVRTHLFADGGRIVDSRKTDYAQHIGAPNLQEIVKKLMQDQHKGLCIALRDGAYDDEGKPAPAAAPAQAPTPAAAPVPAAVRVPAPAPRRASLAPPAARTTSTGKASAPKRVSTRPLANAAPAARASRPPPAASPATGARMSRRPPAPRAAVDVAALERAAEARIAESPIANAPKRRRKAGELPARTPSGPIRGKTLDDVILAYLDKKGRKTGK